MQALFSQLFYIIDDKPSLFLVGDLLLEAGHVIPSKYCFVINASVALFCDRSICEIANGSVYARSFVSISLAFGSMAGFTVLRIQDLTDVIIV